MPPSLALYVHVPFCAARCPYCDFVSYAGLESHFEPYVAALVTEIERAGAARGRPPARTVFIGGGTPTVLPRDLLSRILQACRDAFDLAPDAELTCEANPGAADSGRFDALVASGANRLSLGIQSFDDGELHWLGRIHDAAAAESALRAARTAGFANVNLDLMFGIPGQSTGGWLQTLDRAIELDPEHLSLYGLTVEAGTPLAARVRRGETPAPDDDAAAEMYEAACARLAEAGYVHYEISNWARVRTDPAGLPDHRQPRRSGPAGGSGEISLPAHACRHNLTYWRREPYLGFGAAAHSFDGTRRWWNTGAVAAYIDRVHSAGAAECDGEMIARRTAIGETMMLGLRLVEEGVAHKRFERAFGVTLQEAFGDVIDGLADRGLLERLPDRIRLTPAGRPLGNRVFAEFL